ncbi:MAG: radical SAM protein [Nitrospira bacterium SG8_3]|nr:MAG: radical SAM protein [Nitrospira bacterium SG8_3]
MKIVLVFPPFYLESMYNLAPLGLINLATALKNSPHQVVVIDFVLAIRQRTLKMGKNIYGDCAERILDEAPDLVGFSAQCTTYPAVVQISEKIRNKRPDVKIVVGGHNASFVDRLCLERYPFVDCIVRGEGEISFPELVSAYESGKNEEGILGVTYRNSKDIVRNNERDLISNLDDLPLPDYSFLPPLAKYRDECELARSIAILEVGRGCPHKCIYCSECLMWRRSTRSFSVSRLVKEMGNLYQNFGAECFLLAYDQFTARRKFVESFCHQVIHEGLNHLPWYCISRLDTVDAKLLALMREAGCESMCYGIDSGSKKTLSFIRKNIDHGILYQRVVETADNEIIPTLSYVIGFPVEEKGDIDETLWLALRAGIVGNNNPLIQLPTVLPGTDLHSQYGDRLVREVDTYFALGLEFDGGKRLASDEEIIDSDPKIYSSFYNLPCPGRSLEELNLIASHFPLMVRFYPKSFLLLSLELGESVSDLFLRWLNWLQGHLGRRELVLSPQDCFLHFREFVSNTLTERGKTVRKHFPDVLKYENTALEVGKYGAEKSVFHIDIGQISEFKPIKSKKIIIEKFDFDLPGVILDLKRGNFKESYPEKETLLVFTQDDELLDVSEINAFVRDFLGLCDGKRSVQGISQELYQQYGQDMKPEKFFDGCVEAVQILGKKRFIE